MQVLLAGHPNVGKSTLFNWLSGAQQRTGNYAGVTLERCDARCTLSQGQAFTLSDLPGCYSLSATSPEEQAAIDALTAADASSAVVLCCVDATQLARGLYLVLQLQELGLPLGVVLTHMDAVQQEAVKPQVARLAAALQLPIYPISARHQTGLAALRLALQQPHVFQQHTQRPAAVQAAHLALPPAVWQLLGELTQQLQLPRHAWGRCLWRLTQPAEAHAAAPWHQARQRLALHWPAATGKRQLIVARYQAIDAWLGHGGCSLPPSHSLTTQAWDRWLLHPYVGPLILGLLMLTLLQVVFTGAQPLMQAVEMGLGNAGTWLERLLPAGLTRALLVQGVLPGIGSILAFVPQIALLYGAIVLLESSGYMARAAFLVEALMRRVGLHGKAFVPLLGSLACAVPGILATRTIASRRDRLVTILVAPLISCSARLPVYTLITAAVFAAQPPWLGIFSVGALVLFAMYALGFGCAMATAWLLQHSLLPAPAPTYVLELPRLQMPCWRHVGRSMGRQCSLFLRQTGPLILAFSVLMWGLMHFPRSSPSPNAVGSAIASTAVSPAAKLRQARAQQLEHSWAGQLGHYLEPGLRPLGFDWRIGISLVASFAAREVLVSTLGQLYAVDTQHSLRQSLRQDIDPMTQQPRFNRLVGVSLMVFFVLAMQCMSTVATVARETHSWRWPLLQLVYMNSLAYTLSFVVYQGGRWLGWGLS